MPKTIPCWDCKGSGSVKTYPDFVQVGTFISNCPTCNGGGVLSVYTQVELDEVVKAEREANIKIYNHMLTHIEESPFIKDHIAKKIIKETLEYAEIAIRARNK